MLIRNLDDNVIAAWKERADANGRSLQAELHAELSAAVRKEGRQELIARLKALSARADMSKLAVPSWTLIREDRDAR